MEVETKIEFASFKIISSLPSTFDLYLPRDVEVASNIYL